MSKALVRAGEVRDALQRQIAEAVLGLKAAEISDEAIHDTRKKLKSARAKLRLLRVAIGASAYKRENAALRDAARPLGVVRDSNVMLDTVIALRARKGTRSRRVVLTALRGRLQQKHLAARAAFRAGKQAVSTAGALERAARRIARLRVPKGGTAVLVDGVLRIYRSARKALENAERECTAENLHELRKQVKYLRQALAPYEESGASAAKKIAKHADRVADALGEDHDLYVLHEHIAAAEASTHIHSASFGSELARRRRTLEKRALERSRELLRRKPGNFGKRFSG